MAENEIKKKLNEEYFEEKLCLQEVEDDEKFKTKYLRMSIIESGNRKKYLKE